MKCPKCGKDYEGNFCPNGCNSPYAQSSLNTIKCPKCKTDYVGNFCPNGCNSFYVNSNQHKKIYKRWWFWVAIVAAFLVVVSSLDNGTGDSIDSSVSNHSSELTSSTMQTQKTTKQTTTTISAATKEEAFKNECATIDFKTLSRNPDKYKGQKYKFTGEVIQVMEPTFSWSNTVTLRINITKEVLYDDYAMWSDTIYATVEVPDSEDRILEEDIITFWGTCEGLFSYETVMGNTVSLPKIHIEYYQIQQ